MKNFSREKLRQLIKNSPLSQTQIAEAAGIHKAYITRWITDRGYNVKSPSEEKLQRLAAVLGCSVSDFQDDTLPLHPGALGGLVDVCIEYNNAGIRSVTVDKKTRYANPDIVASAAKSIITLPQSLADHVVSALVAGLQGRSRP